MEYRKFGNNEQLSAIGLGCMSMSHAYGVPDDPESIATLHTALDLGITFWDTADVYGNGKNEELISKVLTTNRAKIFIATKFGFTNDANGKMTFNGSPAYVKKAVEASLKRLAIETIDLYYAHRIDPNVPVEEMVGAMAALVKEGKVRYLGLSEASVSSIRKAHAVHPISAVQSEYSLLTREVEQNVLPACQALGIAFVPFSPLARGLMTNTLDINRTYAFWGILGTKSWIYGDPNPIYRVSAEYAQELHLYAFGGPSTGHESRPGESLFTHDGIAAEPVARPGATLTGRLTGGLPAGGRQRAG